MVDPRRIEKQELDTINLDLGTGVSLGSLDEFYYHLQLVGIKEETIHNIQHIIEAILDTFQKIFTQGGIVIQSTGKYISLEKEVISLNDIVNQIRKNPKHLLAIKKQGFFIFKFLELLNLISQMEQFNLGQKKAIHNYIFQHPDIHQNNSTNILVIFPEFLFLLRSASDKDSNLIGDHSSILKRPGTYTSNFYSVSRALKSALLTDFHKVGVKIIKRENKRNIKAEPHDASEMIVRVVLSEIIKRSAQEQ